MAEKNGTRERIHFVEVQIQNHMRVRRAHVFLPEKGVVPLSGANKAGKTSFKRSLVALVGGDAEVEDAPRNRDAPEDEEAYVIATLSDGTMLRRSFTGAASSPKGRLTAKDGEDRILLQGHLNAIVGPRALRPMRFLDLKPPGQREVLLGFAPGLADTLLSVNRRRDELEVERRPHNSQLQVLGRVQQPAGERPEPVDVSGEMHTLGALQAAQRHRGDVARRVTSLEESLEENQDEAADASKEIEELQERLARAKRELQQITDRGGRLLAEKSAAEAELADMPVVDDEIEAVTARISQAGAVNEALEPWKEWERAQASIAEHRTERDAINDLLAKLELEKRAAIEGADLPFTGLSLDDDGELLIDGSPLSAASGMERCRLALEVAIADDPDLGVVFMNGNELDHDALAEIHRLAEQFDFQVIMDIIHSPGFEGEVRMVDGVAHQDDVAEPVEA